MPSPDSVWVTTPVPHDEVTVNAELLLTYNIFERFNDAVSMSSSNYQDGVSTVDRNSFEDTWKALTFTGGNADLRIHRNSFEENVSGNNLSYGIKIVGASGAYVAENIINSCSVGVYIEDGISPQPASNYTNPYYTPGQNYINLNLFQNGSVGLQSVQFNQFDLFCNTFENCTTAVWLNQGYFMNPNQGNLQQVGSSSDPVSNFWIGNTIDISASLPTPNIYVYSLPDLEVEYHTKETSANGRCANVEPISWTSPPITVNTYTVYPASMLQIIANPALCNAGQLIAGLLS